VGGWLGDRFAARPALGFGEGAEAGTVSPVAFGYALDVTGGWTVPFIASIVLL
jgi:hypothetical protein